MIKICYFLYIRFFFINNKTFINKEKKQATIKARYKSIIPKQQGETKEKKNNNNENLRKSRSN